MSKSALKIALIGNPNSGKSTLFNALTGLNQKIANYPGVTVEKKTGFCKLFDPSVQKNLSAEIIDLPGCYSIYPKSVEEFIPFQFLCGIEKESRPDIVIVIVDGSNLKRSLFLCSQIIDLKIPTLIALNMIDLVKAKGLEIDIKKLSEKLNVAVVTINAKKKEGLDELKRVVLNTSAASHNFLNMSAVVPELISEVKEEIKEPNDYIAFQVLHNIEFLNFSKEIKDKISSKILFHKFDNKKFQAAESLERYKLITKIVQACVAQPEKEKRQAFNESLDKWLTHKVWGYLIFFTILFLMFQAIFVWSSLPMALVERSFLVLSEWISQLLPSGLIKDLIINGVLAGLSGIVVFIPQIALLFMFVAIMEDTGYMARVSFIMDKLMRRFGLNGKSIIPFVSGVACAVPAIMSTRTISNWKERIITIMVTPLMSCSARIPVYTLLISMVIPNNYILGFISLQGFALMALYLIGFIAAIGSAWIMKFFIKAKNKGYFIMEMPVYKMPNWSNIGLNMFEKVKIFLFDAGKVIIAISIVLWMLSSYGPGDKLSSIYKKDNTYVSSFSLEGSVPIKETSFNTKAEKIEASYAGILGKWIEPVIKPLGFDWKIGIGLITSFAAREVFVGTMATIYSLEEDASTLTIRQKMMADINPNTGKPTYSFAVGLSLMIFYAFALQCMSTIAVVYRETNTWKWPIIQIFFMSVLAYLASAGIYQLLK